VDAGQGANPHQGAENRAPVGPDPCQGIASGVDALAGLSGAFLAVPHVGRGPGCLARAKTAFIPLRGVAVSG
jgi:hypothetical protein